MPAGKRPVIDPAVVAATVRRYWGYDTLRPLQPEAIAAGLTQRDSLVVLPTGGGKSLCYQVPPAVIGRTDIVVSPLISLMKDQVDGLRQCGYPAVALNSGQSRSEQCDIEKDIRSGRPYLVFVAPERLVSPGFLEVLQHVQVRAFAIDEAHCISHWGHDFRPEYRQLALLKERFPNASVHAYTATATQRVREDIVTQLGLHNPDVLVGRFDRPNLVYRAIPRLDGDDQIFEIIQRHQRQAVIVYCITRKETERLATLLHARGVRAACYHAGLDSDLRRRTQERFASEELDVVVATVAFGMGIDRSDVRCVIHAALPKSIEHYQQETGRAGRDGLEAECVLLHSPADAMKWERLMRRAAEDQAGKGDDALRASLKLLGHMRGFATAPICRHRLLTEYFGQTYDQASCDACDICLHESADETAGDDESRVIAQKILSCVARVEQRFGIGHVVKVLLGSNDKRLRQLGHHELSTFGLLKEHDEKALTNFVYQLIEQGVLDRTETDRPLLKLNAASWEVMRDERPVRLVRAKSRVVKATQVEAASWADVDRGLFEQLKRLRRQIAFERGVPAFVIFGDASLRDMARRKPTSRADFLNIHGVGQQKLSAFGEQFMNAIRKHGARAAYAAAQDDADATPSQAS